MINDFISRLPGFNHDIVYDLIGYQDLKLCLDVGAAAGLITQRIKSVSSEHTQVLAFEPFPGNHSHFAKNTQDFGDVTLIKKAVSDISGTATFHVPSIIDKIGAKNAENPYYEMLGYSSVGFLAGGVDFDRQVLNNTDNAVEFTVDTVVLDDVVDRHVDFMKMDIQGGEYKALQGCENLIKTHGIDVMYVEFDGDERVLELLTSYGYSIFGTDYLLRPMHGDCARVEAEGFYDFQTVQLSTGHNAYYAKLSLADGDYCSLFKTFRQHHGSIYTDLICVSQSFLPQFLRNLNQFVADQSLQKPSSSSQHSSSPSKRMNLASIRNLTTAFVPALTSDSEQSVEGKPQDLDKRQAMPPLKSWSSTHLVESLAHYRNFLGIAAVGLVVGSSFMAALLPSPWSVIAATLNTVLLLLLIGYSAAKVSHLLAEVEAFKAEQQLVNENLRKALKNKVNKLTADKRKRRQARRQKKRARRAARSIIHQNNSEANT